MRRTLFTLCSAVSLLLCAAVALSWVRSYWRCDVVPLGEPLRGTAWAVRGGISAVRDARTQAGYAVRTVPADEIGQFEHAVGRRPNPWIPARFGQERATGRGYLFVPHWLPLGLFAVAPAAWLARRLRRAHRSACGLCLACGYDVRATPGRCPECGKSPHNPPLERTAAAV